ncbi:hypothetical protein QWY31_00325 [Cytophagales bacterium LB-30]|uniref:Uncharacterized protein n=1 Tax=Shiella aurantiaca TaxID=3058365 RepID=A0ABT8F0F1_9BACT|nr:hypothetical protein [Shiella aurantiaca]MDN4163920.1 hypothetical protein [Shiella aurantiaca]
MKVKSLLYFTSAICLLSSQSLMAQFFTSELHNEGQGGALHFKINPGEESIDGNPFINEEWKTGKVYFSKDAKPFELEKLNFSVYHNEVVYIENDSKMSVPNKNQIYAFTLGDDKFMGVIFNQKDKGFFKLLSTEGEIMVLERSLCVIQKGEPPKGYIEGTKDSFAKRTELYLMKTGHDAIKINPKKGEEELNRIIESEELFKFIKDNKLKMKKKEDLIEAVNYYNSKISS